jgi:hypothetical protein
MKAWINRRTVWKALEATAWLFVAFLIAPASVRAGCGAYSSSNVGALPSVMQMDRLASRLPFDSTDPRPWSARLPCHGASCSGAPVLPNVPVLSAGLSRDDWCHLPVALAATDPKFAGIVPDSAHPAAVHRAPPIDHPPRPRAALS